MISEPRFDIFSGSVDKDAMWIEAVDGLNAARQRMEKIASEVPGRYFVFSSYSRTILAQIDTTKNFIRAEARCKARGAA